MTKAPAKSGMNNRPTTAALRKRGIGLQLTKGWTRRIPSPYALRKGGFPLRTLWGRECIPRTRSFRPVRMTRRAEVLTPQASRAPAEGRAAGEPGIAAQAATARPGVRAKDRKSVV